MTDQFFQSFGSRVCCGVRAVVVEWGVAGMGEGVTTGLGVRVGLKMISTSGSERTGMAVGAGVDSPAQAVNRIQTNKVINNARFMIYCRGKSSRKLSKGADLLLRVLHPFFCEFQNTRKD